MKKKLVLIAAAGAMTVASAGAALALENQFSGMLKIKGDLSNFDGMGGNGGNLAASTPPQKNGQTHAYVEQRARLFYTAKANDDLKLVTGFEMDSRWGDASQVSTGYTRNIGGGIETDQVNLETKHVYLDFKIPSTPVNAKVGLLPYNDAYKGIFLNADVAAMLLSAKIDKATVGFGWLRAYDNPKPLGNNGNGPANGSSGTFTAPATAPTAYLNTDTTSGITNSGRYSLDMTALDLKYALNKDVTIGFSDYLIYDNVGQSGNTGKANVPKGTNWLNTVGVNASANLGAVTVDGFLMYQFGDMPYNGANASTALTPTYTNKVGEKVSAFAANVAAKAKVGPGTLRGSFLYTSGDDGTGEDTNAFQGLNQYTGSTGNFASAQMTMLINTTKHAMNTDRSLIGSSSNLQQGIIGAFFGYDLAIDKTFGSVNLGVAATDKNNVNAPNNISKTGTASYKNGNQLIGTEINCEAGYKLYDNLSVSAVAGYVFLGDYYKDTTTEKHHASSVANAETPDNPWKAQLVLAYTF